MYHGSLGWIFVSVSFSQCVAFSSAKAKTVITLRVPEGHDDASIEKKLLNGKTPVRSRSVPIDTPEIDQITVWEMEEPSDLMEFWWNSEGGGMDAAAAVAAEKKKIGDPFGVVMWPGSILASKELIRRKSQVQNATILVLGAGVGVEAQCAAMLGASKVIAIDIAPLTLELLRFGAEQAGLGNIIEPVQFDLFSDEPLPSCDILVAADVLYNEELAQQIGKRVIEVLCRTSPPSLLITDSQRFHGTDFLDDVNKACPDRPALAWDYFELKNVRGSGVMINEDQTYDATTRMVSAGWKR